MSPTQRPYELGDSSKTGNLLTMFLTGPLMAFCLTSGNTDPSIQQLVDLQVCACGGGGEGEEGVVWCGGGGWVGGYWEVDGMKC